MGVPDASLPGERGALRTDQHGTARRLGRSRRERPTATAALPYDPAVPNMFFIAGAIVAAVGVVLMLAAVFMFLRTRRFLRTAVSVQGVVFDLIASYSSEGGTSYKPAIRFGRLDGGGVGEFMGRIGTNPPRYAVGQVVGVKYDPQRPSNASIDSATNIWLVPGVLAAVGLALLVFGGIFLSIRM